MSYIVSDTENKVHIPLSSVSGFEAGVLERRDGCATNLCMINENMCETWNKERDTSLMLYFVNTRWLQWVHTFQKWSFEGEPLWGCRESGLKTLVPFHFNNWQNVQVPSFFRENSSAVEKRAPTLDWKQFTLHLQLGVFFHVCSVACCMWSKLGPSAVWALHGAMEVEIWWLTV